MGIALLIDGISRLVHGFGDEESRVWSRGFRIGVGTLEVIFGILIMVSPAVGVAFVVCKQIPLTKILSSLPIY
jgi:uncharacterized membrane protein HdeD (DUF308 family)